MAQHFSKTNFLKSGTPLVVGAVSSAEMLRQLVSSPPTTADCDYLELRLDLIALPLSEVSALAAQLSLPLLITARHPDEGGQGHLTLTQRLELLEAVLPHATLVDIELRSAPEMLSFMRKAQAQKVGLIGSFHDFLSTPSVEAMLGAIEFGYQCRVDVVKLATKLNGGEDLGRLLQVLTQEKRLSLSVMGMGELGRISRLTLAKCGSVLNYGYLGESNAPGQWPARRLKELLGEL